MKILLVNKFWFIKGGAERVVLATKKLLETAGHEVEIFGMQDPRNIFQNEYFTKLVDYEAKGFWAHLNAGLRAIYNKEAKNKFAQLVDSFQPDIIHFHNIYHQLSTSLLDVVKEKKLKAVMTLHDYKLISPNYNLFHHGKIQEECAGGKYYQCVLHNCLENFGRSWLGTIEAYYSAGKYQNTIKKFISPSNFLRDKFIANGFGKDNIVVINNPFAKNVGEAKANGKYVLFAGRLTKEKGADLLLKVAEQLPKIKFKIVGDGPLANSLRQEKQAKNLINVELTGYQQGEELDNLYLNAEMVVAPSVWYENAPLSVLEGMGAGKIVLGSEIGGIPEILPTEFLFKPGDVLGIVEKIKFWHEKSVEEKQEAGERLLAIVRERFGEEKYLEKILQIYKEILNF